MAEPWHFDFISYWLGVVTLALCQIAQSWLREKPAEKGEKPDAR